MTRTVLLASVAAAALAAGCASTQFPSPAGASGSLTTAIPTPLPTFAPTTSLITANPSSPPPSPTTSAVPPRVDETIETIPPGARTCPLPVTSYIPPGFALSARSTVDSGGGRLAVNTTYRDATSAELSFGWGMWGEVGGRPTGERVSVRGQSVPLLQGQDVFVVVWFEAPLDEPCNQYFVTGYLVPRVEFLKVLAGIR